MRTVQLMMKKFAVVGHNVAYSRSPRLHSAGFDAMEIDAEFEIVDVAPDNLADWIKNNAFDYAGFAVTKPYKDTIRQYLAQETQAVAATSACNTVTVLDGRLVGTNTDGLGAVRALQTAVDLDGKTVLVLGAGGAARAIVQAISGFETKGVIWNRTHEKAQELAEKYEQWTSVEDLATLNPGQIDIVIQTTTVGLNEDVSLLPADFFHPAMTVMDIVYSPLETTLLRHADAAGATIVTGDHMLVHQALAQFQIWHGVSLDPEVMHVAFFE